MATGTLTIAANAESITKGTDSAGYKVYFYNEKNWASPYLYCYEGSKSNAAWPGQAMKAEADGWYSYEISGYSQPRVIFSNKGAGQLPSQNQEGYLVSASKWFMKGTWYDEQPEGITLHYFNENRWEQPYVYYYYETDTPIDWPGVPMNSEGDGWYNYTVYGMEQVYAIFSDKGKDQDPQYTDYDDDGYSFNGEMWVAHKLAYVEKPDRVTVHFYNKNAWEEHVYEL